jgi:hypothetical protein
MRREARLEHRDHTRRRWRVVDPMAQSACRSGEPVLVQEPFGGKPDGRAIASVLQPEADPQPRGPASH